MNRKLCATPHIAKSWSEIDFRAAEHHVKKLQMRIAKAVSEGRHGKVKSLQWLLTHSFYAKALAVKRVTENKGKRTSGVDRELWDTPIAKIKAVEKLCRRGYRPMPLRRVYIPKKNGKKRPLGIPTMTDRAMQTLYKFALEPVAETMADYGSYGFRPKRCVQDAIEHCFSALARKSSATWILEGDIKGCFDNISHDWMLEHIPLDKEILRKFLKSGFMEKKQLFPTDAGTPQGGSISPILANMVLDGLENTLKSRFVRTSRKGITYNPKVNFIRYADDFIVTGESEELLREQVLPVIRAFLKERGLSLSEEKTLITHIDNGFDFLGCNVRKYKGKLLVKPSKQSIKSLLAKARGIIRQHKSRQQRDLIHALNPVIRGWANNQRFNVSSRVFQGIDYQIWKALWRWALRRHKRKGKKWIARRYFNHIRTRVWTFSAKIKARDNEGKPIYQSLVYAGEIPIVRFRGIKSSANPFSKADQFYFEERETDKMRRSLKGRKNMLWLFNRQKGLCIVCGERMTQETSCKVHFSTASSTKSLVHPKCHKSLHSQFSEQSASCGSMAF